MALILVGLAVRESLVRQGAELETQSRQQSVDSERPAKSQRHHESRGAERMLTVRAAVRRWLETDELWTASGKFKSKSFPTEYETLSRELEAALGELTGDELRALFEDWTVEGEVTRRHYFLVRLIERWATLEPEQAWAAMKQLYWKDGKAREGAGEITHAVFMGWARVDPTSAFERYHTTSLPLGSVGGVDGTFSASIPVDIIAAYAAVEPMAAWNALARVKDDTAMFRATGRYYDSLPAGHDWAKEAVQFDQHPLLEQYRNAEGPARFGVSFAFYNGITRESAQTLAERWVADDPAAAIEWYVNRADEQDEGTPWGRDGRLSTMLHTLCSERPEAALSWIEDNVREQKTVEELSRQLVSSSGAPQVARAFLPHIRSESERFRLLQESAMHLQRSRTAEWELDWTAADLREVLPVAQLTPENEARLRELLAGSD